MGDDFCFEFNKNKKLKIIRVFKCYELKSQKYLCMCLFISSLDTGCTGVFPKLEYRAHTTTHLSRQLNKKTIAKCHVYIVYMQLEKEIT